MVSTELHSINIVRCYQRRKRIRETMREFEINQRKVNIDGSRNIFCKQCGEFIVAMSTAEVYNSAICYICQRAEQGLPPLPENVRAMLRSQKIGPNTYIPMSVANPPMV